MTHNSNLFGQFGRACTIVLLASSTLSRGQQLLWSAEGPVKDAQLGQRVSEAGDIEGDGISDVVVTSILPNLGYKWIPNVTVYSGATGSPIHSIEMDVQPYSSYLLAFSATGVGDLNGDGFGEIFVGDLYATTAPPMCIPVGIGARCLISEARATTTFLAFDRFALGTSIVIRLMIS
jgi:hypothetical protein